jgi:hypothetical protein
MTTSSKLRTVDPQARAGRPAASPGLTTLPFIAAFALAACSQTQADRSTVAAQAEEAKAEAPADGPVFNSVGELTLPDEVQPELRGGRVADPRDWPASFYTRSAGGSCTASIIGDRVLLTAAHCVENGAVVTLRHAGLTYRAPCEHAPEYGGTRPEAATADYALCALDRSLPGVPAERVNTRALRVGEEVLLTGFGCTTDRGTGGNDGIYRVGEASVVVVPSGDNNDIVVSGRAGLCFGDSGGPAFLIGPGRRRVQVSVNSRVENRNPTGVELGPRSFLSSLSSPQGAAFLRDWSRRNELHICGLDSEATTCRS